MATSTSQRDVTPELCASAVEVCLCANFRRVTRVLTSLFDTALQQSGLRATQLIVLLSIVARESPTIAELARTLDMDSSTLNRNLQPLKRQRLVRSVVSPNKRHRPLTVTAKGMRAIEKAVPLWQKTQSEVVKTLGKKQFSEMLDGIQKLAEIAGKA